MDSHENHFDSRKLHLIGYASGLAGASPDTGKGPLVIQQSPLINEWLQKGSLIWSDMIYPRKADSLMASVSETCVQLAKVVSPLVKQGIPVSVIGGDHAAAIGTFSGVYDALHAKGEFGLIWIDAHMDSHTPLTTFSGRIHGMPLASLLGKGDPLLTHILQAKPKLQPENVCLIGVRSYEEAEKILLQSLEVKIYYMDEVMARGIETILAEAVDHISRKTIAYGISLDLDSLDPDDAPGVDVPEPNGIAAKDLLYALNRLAQDKRLVATEIVEFDPERDKDHRTEKLVIDTLQTLYSLPGK